MLNTTLIDENYVSLIFFSFSYSTNQLIIYMKLCSQKMTK